MFPLFYLSYWEVQFLYTPERGRKEEAGAENGKRDSPKSERERGVSVLGAFKLDHLKPVKLILLQKKITFLPSLQQWTTKINLIQWPAADLLAGTNPYLIG